MEKQNSRVAEALEGVAHATTNNSMFCPSAVGNEEINEFVLVGESSSDYTDYKLLITM